VGYSRHPPKIHNKLAEMEDWRGYRVSKAISWLGATYTGWPKK